MKKVSIVISTLALTVSIFVAWKNYLSPFSLSLHSGNPRLEPIQSGGRVIRFAVILPLYFINNGARDGLIQDIMLNVSSGQNAWLFYPAFYCEYSVFTEATLANTLTKNSSNVPFYPIHLQGKESSYKSIIFVPDAKNVKFPLGNGDLLPGKYQFCIKTLDKISNDYEKKLTFNITLSEKQINDLTSSHILIPFLDEVTSKRQAMSAETQTS